MGWLSLDEAGGTGVATSGPVMRVGALVWLAVTFSGSGASETGQGPGGLGGSADGSSVDDAATGPTLSRGLESEFVSDSSLTADSGASGKNAGTDAVFKIFSLTSGTMLASGARVSGAACTEALADFGPLLMLPFVATLPIAPKSFGLADVS
jgi:hypothetical protein